MTLLGFNFQATNAVVSATKTLDGGLENISAIDIARLSSMTDKRPALSLDFEHFSGVLVLHCHGRILFRAGLQVLPTVLAEVLPSAGRMVVDLSDVAMIDSGGLGELVMAHMWAEAAGYTLMFAHPRKPVRSLFEITNLVSLFNLYDTVPEAIIAMGHGDARSA